MNPHSIVLRPLRLGLSLGVFVFIGYAACLALAFVVPDGGLHRPWLQFFPGFAWTAPGILIGAGESLGYGLVAGIVFAPIANYFGIARVG
jgi:hypothetical protein